MIICIWTHLSALTETFCSRYIFSLPCCIQDPREPDNGLERKPAYDPLNVDEEEFQLSRSCLKRSPVATEQTFWDSPNIERPQSAQENDLRNIQICSRGHKVRIPWSLLNIHFQFIFVLLFSHLSCWLRIHSAACCTLYNYVIDK